jgi:hypothetical protein
LLATSFRVIPHIGPFKALAFKPLTPEAEKLYMASFNTTIDRYREYLSEVREDRLKLANQNIDMGELSPAGKYKLTDGAYSKLLHKLDGHYTEAPVELRSNILAFYQDLSLPISTKEHPADWSRLLEELDRLKAVNGDLTVAMETPPTK